MVRLVILRLLESWFRHWWLYIIPVILMLLVGVVQVLQTPTTYTASLTLFVEDRSLLADLTDAPAASDFSWRRSAARTIQAEYGELMQTEAFMRALIQNTKLEARASRSRDDLADMIYFFRKSVSVRPAGGQLVIISARTEDPQLSLQMVESMINTFVAWKLNVQYQETAAAQAFFAEQIPVLEQEVQQARDALTVFEATYPEPLRGPRSLDEQIELQRLQGATNDALRRLDVARDKEENARLILVQAESVLRQTYQVLDAPELPQPEEIGERAMAMQIGIAGAIGVALSIVGVIGGAVIDRSIRFPIDARHLLHLPTLATVPQTDLAATFEGQKLSAKHTDHESYAPSGLPNTLGTVPPTSTMSDQHGQP